MDNISVSQNVDGETIVWIHDQQHILTERETDTLVSQLAVAKMKGTRND